MQRFRSLLVAGVTILAACAREGSLTNRQARDLLDTTVWKVERRESVFLGKLKFVDQSNLGSDGTINVEDGEMWLDGWPQYQAFHKLGLITLSEERDIGNEFSGWTDWFALTQRGIRKMATVRVTPKGLQAGTVRSGGTVSVLNVNISSTKTKRIITNQIGRAGTDVYRIIEGTFTKIVEPEFRQVWADLVEPAYEGDRKFRVLLKYDPFEGKWTQVTYDIVATGDFRTNYVARAVSNFQIKL